MKINRLPRDDKTNGWSAILPARTPHAALQDEVTADWLVLGGGYAGLAAARRLAENCPDQKIVLIEAGQAGENASGRNSGFGIDLPHNVGSSLDELDGSHRFMRLARMALDHLQEVVRTHDIKCDWRRAGKYHTAVSPRGTRNVLQPFSKSWRRWANPMNGLKVGLCEKSLDQITLPPPSIRLAVC